MGSYLISELRSDNILRIPTGFNELDWLFGYTSYGNRKYWGIPQGKITILSGVSGVGKSRFAIELAKNLTLNNYNVLYFQNEVDLPAFCSWIKKGRSNFNKFRVSSDITVKDQIGTIISDSPNVVFIDSINQVEEYRNGSKRDIKKIIEGDKDNMGFRELCKISNIHVVFLAQLNQDGTIKGSTTLAHLSDILIDVYPSGLDDHFVVGIGGKNRYGRTGEMFNSLWKHKEEGVECVSKNRYRDKIWCEDHNQKIQIIFPDIVREKILNNKELIEKYRKKMGKN